MKQLNILLAFTVQTTFDINTNETIYTYNYHIYTSENNTLPDYLEHDIKQFNNYEALVNYARNKAFNYFGTNSNDYHTIHFY